MPTLLFAVFLLTTILAPPARSHRVTMNAAVAAESYACPKCGERPTKGQLSQTGCTVRAARSS